MYNSPKNRHFASCICGSVELEIVGSPILSAACHCDDCQEGSRRLEQLQNAPPILDRAGGTAYLLYRKDRMQCSKGAERLVDYRLKDESPTRRVVASCCNAFMFVDFQKGHWFSIYRGRFEGEVPPLQMRFQTKFKPEGSELPSDAPIYRAYPPKLIGKLVGARIAMLFGR